MTRLESIKMVLLNEQARLASITSEAERKFLVAWIAQLEKDAAGERKFLSLADVTDMGNEDVLGL